MPSASVRLSRGRQPKSRTKRTRPGRGVMNRSLLAVVISQGVLFAIAGGQASAQYPYQRPPLISYLNLERPGGAFNYYGLVKPYEDYTKTVSGLQQQITTTQQDVQKVATERAGGGT